MSSLTQHYSQTAQMLRATELWNNGTTQKNTGDLPQRSWNYVINNNSIKLKSKFWVWLHKTRHPCIPPSTPAQFHELCQWNIIGLICGKSQKEAVKSNLGKFLRKCNFYFFNAFCLTLRIELMFPKDSQILVDDFRHQNFGIWTILSWIMAIFMKK